MELVQHINQTQLCACVFVLSLAPGLDRLRPIEKGRTLISKTAAHLGLMIGPTVL